MAATVEEIRQLREETSCGVIECKKALEEANGDVKKAKDILRLRGLELAAKKGSREAKEGRVEVYIHPGNKVGVLVELNCETDFVARNEEFITFSKDLAMHIAAMAPTYVSENDIPEEELAQAAKQEDFNKEEYIKTQCLLPQPFVKNTKLTIQDSINELIAKIGENILIGRFIRYKIG